MIICHKTSTNPWKPMPGEAVLDWILSIGQKELNCVLRLYWIVWNWSVYIYKKIHLALNNQELLTNYEIRLKDILVCAHFCYFWSNTSFILYIPCLYKRNRHVTKMENMRTLFFVHVYISVPQDELIKIRTIFLDSRILINKSNVVVVF